jgi:hypothetical protein
MGGVEGGNFVGKGNVFTSVVELRTWIWEEVFGVTQVAGMAEMLFSRFRTLNRTEPQYEIRFF